MAYRIFIIEDDEKIAELLGGYLTRYGYEAIRAKRFAELTEELREASPDMVLLDIALPHYDGFYWCRQFRAVTNAPILFLSARSHELDQVMAIENGGDDYLTKPFSLEVVLAKVKGALRRAYGEYAQADPREPAEVGGLRYDRGKLRLECVRDGRRVQLTRNESLLFEKLAESRGSVVSREKLLAALWDDAAFVDDNTLTVNVARLRKKLEELGGDLAIVTVRQKGYRLALEGTGDVMTGEDG